MMEKDTIKLQIMERREIMKAYPEDGEEIICDQNAGMAQPPLEKACIGTTLIKLSKDFDKVITKSNILELINTRISRRRYTEDKLTLTELSFLLWATQGVKSITGTGRKSISISIRACFTDICTA
jgi:hypothetical protein